MKCSFVTKSIIAIGISSSIPLVAAAAPPGFAVESVQLVTRDNPRGIAEQRAEADLWHQAFLRCSPSLEDSGTSDPIRIGAVKVEASTTGKDPMIRSSARFACGLHDAPDLKQRLAAAQQVIVGRVANVRSAGIKEPITEHAADWQIATIEVREALKGGAAVGSKIDVYFPRSDDVAWRSSPRFVVGQEGVWLLQVRSTGPSPWVATTLDAHPAARASSIRSLLP